MDIIFDIITLPFDIIGGSIECLFSCLFIAGAIACCATLVIVFNVL